MTTKSERFELRLDESTLDAVDAWRAKQEDIPTRAEAFRRLVDIGLRVPKNDMQFTSGELLITHMLADIYQQFKIRNGVDPDFVRDALFRGHYWALEWQYPGIFHGYKDDPRILPEVIDILDMWSFVEAGSRRLSKADIERVKKEAKPFGENIKFPGFDGNSEATYLGVANFLVQRMDRFSEFKDRDLNSHAPLLDNYRRMLPKFLPIRTTLTGRNLSATEITKILTEMIHPSNRT